MDARRQHAMDRGREGGKLKRLELVLEGAPAVLHSARDRPRSGTADDPFDVRVLLGGVGGVGGGRGTGDSRLGPEHDFERYVWLICAELQDVEEGRLMKQVVQAHAAPQYLLPTQEELLRGSAQGVAADTPVSAQVLAEGVDERRAEAVAARYGLRDFAERLERMQGDESGERRSRSGGKGERESGQFGRLRDEDADVEEEEEGDEKARDEALMTQWKRQRVEDEEEEEADGKREETPKERLARMLAEQLAQKRAVDGREAARRAASVQTEVVFETGERSDKDKKRAKKEEKKRKKETKKDKKKSEMKKKKPRKDPLDAALEALKKKHNL
jgi:hypothetical protein